MEHDKFRWGIHLIGRTIPDVGDEEHLFAYKNMKLLYEQYVRAKRYSIVVEGLFTWGNQTASQGNVKDLIELAARYNVPCKSVVLTANKATLLKRNAARSYAVPIEEFEMLYTNVYDHLDPSEIVIDSTHQRVPETLSAVKSALI